MVTTDRFEPEVRIDMYVPTTGLPTLSKGQDITSLLKSSFLNGYPEEEVCAVTLGNGSGSKVKVAFLWEDAGDAEYWYVNRQISKGISEDRAMDKFYEVAQNLMD